MKVLSAILVGFLACQTVNTIPVPFFSGITSGISGFIGDKITATGNTVNGIKDTITKPIKGVKEAVDNTLTFTDNALNEVKEVVDGSLTLVDNTANGVKNVFDTISTVNEMTLHGVKDIADITLNTLNTVDNTVNGIKDVVGNTVSTVNGVKDFVVGNTITAAGNTLDGIKNIAEGATGIFTGAASHMGDLMGNAKNELSTYAKKAKGAAKEHIDKAIVGIGSLNKKVENILSNMEHTIKDVIGESHHSIENMYVGLTEKTECIKKFIIFPLEFKMKYINKILACEKDVETAVEKLLADVKTTVTQISDNARTILSKDALSSMKNLISSIPELAIKIEKNALETVKHFVGHVKDVVTDAVTDFKQLLECGKKLKLI